MVVRAAALVAMSLSLPSCCGSTSPAPSVALVHPVVSTGAAATMPLSGPSASHAIPGTYPRNDVRLELAFRYDQPGTILGTLGNGAPSNGTFRLSVEPSGNVEFQVFDPKTISPIKNAAGWQILRSQTTVPPGTVGVVVIELYKGDIALRLKGKLEKRTSVEHTQLSGEPVYAGVVPGAEPGSLTGTVWLAYFGPLNAKTYVADRKLEIASKATSAHPQPAPTQEQAALRALKGTWPASGTWNVQPLPNDSKSRVPWEAFSIAPDVNNDAASALAWYHTDSALGMGR